MPNYYSDKDRDKRIKDITGSEVKNGQELQAITQAQGELSGIQSELQNSLAMEQSQAASRMQNNQLLQQAAGMMAADQGVSAQVAGMNMNTQQIMQKYGIQPGQTNKQVSNSNIVRTQAGTYNYKTENITNTKNEIHITQPQIPVSQPNIPMQQGAQQAKLQTWLSGIFAKQENEYEIQKKEFRKREWSLNRAANKMMSRIETASKTFAEKMDPRNMTASAGGQMKTVLWGFGLWMLAKYWNPILKAVDSVVKWFTDKKDGFLGSIRSVFNVKEGEGMFEGVGATLKDGFDLLIDYLKFIFEDRATAIKQVFDLDFGDKDFGWSAGLGNTEKIMVWMARSIGNLFRAAIGGTTSIQNIAEDNIREDIEKSVSNAGKLSSENRGKFTVTRRLDKDDDNKIKWRSSPGHYYYMDQNGEVKEERWSMGHYRPLSDRFYEGGRLAETNDATFAATDFLGHYVTTTGMKSNLQGITAQILSDVSDQVEKKGELVVSASFMLDFIRPLIGADKFKQGTKHEHPKYWKHVTYYATRRMDDDGHNAFYFTDLSKVQGKASNARTNFEVFIIYKPGLEYIKKELDWDEWGMQNKKFLTSIGDSLTYTFKKLSVADQRYHNDADTAFGVQGAGALSVNRLDALTVDQSETYDNKLLGIINSHNRARPIVKSIINGISDLMISDNSETITKEKRDIGVYIAERLMNDLGISPDAAIGIVANLYRESRFDPKADQNGDGSGGLGIAQWTTENRKENFRKLLKKDIKDATLDEQIQFLEWEIQNPGKAGFGNNFHPLNFLRKEGKTAKDVADYMCDNFFRPKDKEGDKKRNQGFLYQLCTHWNNHVTYGKRVEDNGGVDTSVVLDEKKNESGREKKKFADKIKSDKNEALSESDLTGLTLALSKSDWGKENSTAISELYKKYHLTPQVVKELMEEKKNQYLEKQNGNGGEASWDAYVTATGIEKILGTDYLKGKDASDQELVKYVADTAYQAKKIKKEDYLKAYLSDRYTRAAYSPEILDSVCYKNYGLGFMDTVKYLKDYNADDWNDPNKFHDIGKVQDFDDFVSGKGQILQEIRKEGKNNSYVREAIEASKQKTVKEETNTEQDDKTTASNLEEVSAEEISNSVLVAAASDQVEALSENTDVLRELVAYFRSSSGGTVSDGEPKSIT